MKSTTKNIKIYGMFVSIGLIRVQDGCRGFGANIGTDGK